MRRVAIVCLLLCCVLVPAQEPIDWKARAEQLAADNARLRAEFEQLSYEFYGGADVRVEPEIDDGKPSCPVEGFILRPFVMDQPVEKTVYEDGQEQTVIDHVDHIFKKLCVRDMRNGVRR